MKLDSLVKEDMIQDTINLLDSPAFDHEALVRICKRRISSQSLLTTAGRNDQQPKMEGGGTATLAMEKDQLEQDLQDILLDRLPWKYGKILDNMGNYQWLTPVMTHERC